MRTAQIWAGTADPILANAWVYPGASRDGSYLDYTPQEDLDPFSGSRMA